jgi:hypothetical protein
MVLLPLMRQIKLVTTDAKLLKAFPERRTPSR